MIPILSLLAVAGFQQPDTALPIHETRHGIRYEFVAADRSLLPSLQMLVEGGRTNAERFFGGRFRAPLIVRIYPNRRALTAHWAAAWGVPDLHTDCWAVASGVATELALLTPRAWKTDACEHDSADSAATRRLLWHEMIHVYHGQWNPHPTFDRMDDLGWLVEGVATLASGQLAVEHAGDASAAIHAGSAPTRLADAWSGRYRYGVSGSLVAFVDSAWGRPALTRLLADTTQADVLTALHTTEDSLLARWRAWVRP